MKRIAPIFIAVIMILIASTTVYADDGENDTVIAEFKSGYIPDDKSIKLKLQSGFGFLDQSSETLNWELALTGAVLSKEVYDFLESDPVRGKYYDFPGETEARSVIQPVLIDLGYDYTRYYYYPDHILTSFKQPACCFGYKHIANENGKAKNIFVIVVRGTHGGTDGITDLIDGSDYFEDSTESVIEDFVKFINDTIAGKIRSLKQEENFFFITGHSLGGAVANRLSASNTILDLAGNDKNKIYTYTYEAAHTCMNNLWTNPQEMSNAFNFKDVDDAVTNLPPWPGATRYGTDLEYSVGYDPNTINPVSRGYYECVAGKYVIDVLNQVFLNRVVENLDNQIFTTLFPNAKGGSVIEAPRVYNHETFFGFNMGHHDMGLPLTYILQKGIQAKVWESVEDVLQTKKIADYEIIRDEQDKKGYDVEVYFERPKFEEITSGYQRINKFFEDQSNTFFSEENMDLNTLWEFAEEFSEYEPDVSSYGLECFVSTEVAYQSESLVSVLQFRTYCYGGADYSWNEGYLFHTDTGEQITLAEIIDATEDEIKEMIEQEICSKYPVQEEVEFNTVHRVISEYALEDFDFYLKGQEIHITFPKYAMLSGSIGIIDITLPVIPKTEYMEEDVNGDQGNTQEDTSDKYSEFKAGYRAAMRYPEGKVEKMEPIDIEAIPFTSPRFWTISACDQYNAGEDGAEVIDCGDYYEVKNCLIEYPYFIPHDIYDQFEDGFEFDLSLQDQNGQENTIHNVANYVNGHWLLSDNGDPYDDDARYAQEEDDGTISMRSFYGGAAWLGKIYYGSLYFTKDCIVHDFRFKRTETFEEYVTKDHPYTDDGEPRFQGGKNEFQSIFFQGKVIFDLGTGMITECQEMYQP